MARRDHVPKFATGKTDSVPFGGLTLHRFRLDNGLELRVLPDSRAPIVSYQSWFRVGSADEEPGRTGQAHFFEHLMFGATDTREEGELDRTFEAVGAEINAATWTDWTYYYETCPKRAWTRCVELESDRMVHLKLERERLLAERDVVLSERRSRVDDDVEGLAVEKLYALALKGHAYAWPTLGWARDIRRFDLRASQAFYRRWYAPNNLTLVVAGDVSPADVLRRVQKAYGSIPASKLPRRAARRTPAQRKQRRTTLSFVTPTPKFAIGYRAPAFGSPDWALLSVVCDILFGSRGARFPRSLVHERELCVSARAHVTPFRDGGLFDVWLSLREDVEPANVLELFDRELTRFLDEGPTPAELTRAQNSLEFSFLTSMETIAGKAEQIGFYESVLGDATRVFDRLEAYQSASVESVRDVARRYLDSTQRSVVEVVPKVGA
ncbi:MAG: insulinase family protein [Deltaproteobacteria bacterium]|nr:insulinase family protein [Deltaproteobacteria bacterium]